MTGMTIERWYDSKMNRYRIDVKNVSPEVMFSMDLLAEADSEYLIYNGNTITINVDNGKWIWQVISVDRDYRTVLGRWPD